MLKNKRSTTPVVKEKPKQATGEKAVVFARRSSVNTECHWSEILRDIVLINETNREITELYFDLSGGADHGQFPYVGTVTTTPDSRGISVSTSVDVRVGDVLLEVQERKVSGYTQADVVAWIKHCLRSRDSPVVIKTVPEGRIVCLIYTCLRSWDNGSLLFSSLSMYWSLSEFSLSLMKLFFI